MAFTELLEDEIIIPMFGTYVTSGIELSDFEEKGKQYIRLTGVNLHPNIVFRREGHRKCHQSIEMIPARERLYITLR